MLNFILKVSMYSKFLTFGNYFYQKKLFLVYAKYSLKLISITNTVSRRINLKQKTV